MKIPKVSVTQPNKIILITSKVNDGIFSHQNVSQWNGPVGEAEIFLILFTGKAFNLSKYVQFYSCTQVK